MGTGRTQTQGDLGTCLSRAVGTAPRASDVEKTVGGALDRGHPCRVRLQVGRKEKWYDILEKITRVGMLELASDLERQMLLVQQTKGGGGQAS